MSDLKPGPRYYDAEKNPDGMFLTGVPLRDLTEDEYRAYPDWLKQSIDAAPFYRATPLPKPKAPAKED